MSIFIRLKKLFNSNECASGLETETSSKTNVKQPVTKQEDKPKQSSSTEAKPVIREVKKTKKSSTEVKPAISKDNPKQSSSEAANEPKYNDMNNNLSNGKEVQSNLLQLIKNLNDGTQESKDAFLVFMEQSPKNYNAFETLSKNQDAYIFYTEFLLEKNSNQIPADIECLILATDDPRDWVKYIDTRTRHTWSRKAKNYAKVLHPELYREIFDRPPVYDTFFD